MISIVFLLVLVTGAIAVCHAGQLASLVLAAIELRRQRRLPRALLREAAAGAGALPGVSAILLGQGDGAAVSRAIDRLLEQRYPDLEILVVLDSATGYALDALCDRFDLQPADPRPCGGAPTEHVRAVFVARANERLIVVDKRGEDRADGWNAALNLATKSLVLPLDAAHTLGPQAIAEAALAFALDSTLVAAAMTVRIGGAGGRAHHDASAGVVSVLAELQELRRALGGLALAGLDSYVGAASAVTLYTRSALVRAGGFHPRSPEPDREMLFRLHASLRAAQTPYRIARAADGVVWRPAPTNWGELASAEARRLQASTLWLQLYGGVLADQRFGMVARLAIPYAWLELAMPILEAVGWLLLLVGVALTDMPAIVALLFVSATLGLGLAVSLAALIVDLTGFDPVPEMPQTLRRAGLAAVEQLGPRQVALWPRLRALLAARRVPIGV